MEKEWQQSEGGEGKWDGRNGEPKGAVERDGREGEGRD